MCKYCLVKIAGFHLRSWMIIVAVLCALYALGSLLYFLVMFIWDIVRVAKKDYVWQLMPNRKLIRNYLYRSYITGFRRFCITDFKENIEHTFDGAKYADDPFDDDDDRTDSALGSQSIDGRSMQEDLVYTVDEDWEVEHFFRGKKSQKDKRRHLEALAFNADRDFLKRNRQQMMDYSLKGTRLARNPPYSFPRATAKPAAKPKKDGKEKPYGAACVNATSSKNPPIKQMFKKKFADFCIRPEKRFSIVIIIVDLFMLIMNIIFLVTCYCFIVSIRRKDVNLAIGFVVMAGVCMCVNPCYWVARLGITPPWGYFNGLRIALTVIFILLFWALLFFAIYMAAKFFYYCFLVELDATSPLVLQSDLDQKTMKHDIET